MVKVLNPFTTVDLSGSKVINNKQQQKMKSQAETQEELDNYAVMDCKIYLTKMAASRKRQKYT